MSLRYTDHASQRMAERGISRDDVESVVRRPVGAAQPGSGLGNLTVVGRVGPLRLKVVLSAADPELVISVWEVKESTW